MSRFDSARSPKVFSANKKNGLQLGAIVWRIWGENAQGPYGSDPERLLKVAQCAAEDELYRERGIESEQIELVLHLIAEQSGQGRTESNVRPTSPS